MMRRSFLQQTGLALLTLLASEIGLLQRGKGPLSPSVKNYLDALAEPTNRKLALLVGINEYSRNLGLTGCLTDVELQKELLIHRFGFQPSDIITLTNKEATRENIETAFIEHLTQQAKSNDVVVFHFSGYGMGVNIPEPIAADLKMADATEADSNNLINGLVTSDVTSLVKNTSAVNGILEETLILLANSLATDRVTLVLDTSYKITENSLVGGLRARSLPVISQQPSPEELSFQQGLKQKYPQAIDRPLSGTILQATRADGIATETVWDGFSAGLFTHALTQFLWQVTPASTIQFSLARTTEAIASMGSIYQQPRADFKDKKPLLMYYCQPESLVGAEGFIKAIDDTGSVAIDLGGIPAKILNNYGIGSCFTVVSNRSQQESLPSEDLTSAPEQSEPILLQIRSREGLSAKAKLISQSSDNKPEVGQLVRESIRILPRNLGTIVALDAQLERIERVDGTSAFANINSVSEVVIAGDEIADCLFGRAKPSQIEAIQAQTDPDTEQQATEDKSNSLGGYGLFTIDGVLIPNTVGIATEAVKSAVRRLIPQLETLLAAKLWGLTVNQGSSNLAVEVTLALVEPENKILLKQQTLRSLNSGEKQFDNISVRDLSNFTEQDSTVTIARGSKIQYQIENQSDRPIYPLILGLDSESSPIALYSPELNGNSTQLKNTAILPRETIIVPQPSASLNWIVSGAKGISKVHVICSIAPFEQTLKALLAMQHLKGDKERILDLPNPLETARALLFDLHSASGASPNITGSSGDVWALDVSAWANLSFVYRVV